MKKNCVRKLSLRILAVISLTATAALIAHQMDAAAWVDKVWPSEKSLEAYLETLHAEKYIYGTERPIDFGSIRNPINAYFRLKLRFRIDPSNGSPSTSNMFQTAPADRGLRVEISGSTATVMIPEKPSVSPGTRRMILTAALEASRWHILEVEAMNGAFVRANLDGRPVALYGGSEISVETSQFLLGDSLGGSRPFSGEIADITLIKGNLLDPPRRGIALIYAVVALLVAIFAIALWFCLSDWVPVRRLMTKLALLALPLALTLGYYEYRLSFVNTVYFNKRIALEEQLEKIEIAVTGSSNTFYGVNPEAFSHYGFNMAFPGHGMFYDTQMIQKFSKRMPALRMVVLTVNYFTLGVADAEFTQSWRTFFDRQYFGLPRNGEDGLLRAWKFWLQPSNFSKIALYGGQVEPQARQDYKAPVDVITLPSGWFDAGDVPADPLLNFGARGARAHNASTNENNYDQNLQYWDEFIRELKHRRIAVAIVELPTDSSYYTFLDPVKTEAIKRKLGEFARRHGIRFVDYTGDSRFSSSDFSWELVDHMNGRGATKFSKILDEEIIQPELKRAQ